MEKGRVYRVISVNSSHPHHFYRLGIMLDVEISIVAKLPLHGPVIVEVGGRRIALRENEFKCLVLE